MLQAIFRGLIPSGAIALAMISGAFACTLPELRPDERPDPAGVPTLITASFVVADFLGVDDVNQQLDLDMVGYFSWKDKRLAELEGCRFSINEVWFPPIIIFNSSDLRVSRRNAREQIAVGPDSTVTYTNRFTGLISSYHNLRRFPFDKHDFEIRLGSIERGVDVLQFVADSENTWIADDRLNIEGWDVKGVSLSTRTTVLPHHNREVSVMTLIISAARNGEYYVYRVMFLLAFVVAMSWVIFWVPPNRFEFQIGIGATSMLTVIAFNLAIANNLPRLGYLTILDRVLIWSIFLVFLSIVEALVAGLLVLNGREAQALRLDIVSRIGFPLLLFGGWSAAILMG